MWRNALKYHIFSKTNSANNQLEALRHLRQSVNSRSVQNVTRKGARTNPKIQHSKLTLAKSNSLPQQNGALYPGQCPLPAARSGRPGFLGAMMDGLAHGVGWAFGMRAVDALFGPRHSEIVHHPDSSDTTPGASPGDSPEALDHQEAPNQLQENSSFQNNFGQSSLGQEGWQWGSDDSGENDFDFDI